MFTVYKRLNSSNTTLAADEQRIRIGEFCLFHMLKQTKVFLKTVKLRELS